MKVLSLLKPYTKFLIIAWILMGIELTVELISPLFMARIIDEGVMQRDIDTVIYWGIFLIIISIISFVSGILNSFIAAHAGQNFGFDIRKNLYKKIQKLSFSTLNQFPTSSFITRLTNDVTQLQNIVFMSLRIAFRAPLLIIFGTVMALLVNVKLGLVFLLAIPFLVVFLIFVMKKGFGFFQTVQNRLDRVNRVMRENLSGIRVVKAFYNRIYEQKRFVHVNKELMDSTMVALRFVEISAPILLFIMNMCIIAVLWIGNTYQTIGGVQAGEIVATVNYGTRITHALAMLSWIIMSFSRAKASTDRINEVLMMDEETEEEDYTALEEINGNLDFDKVSFRYDTHLEMALSNISFSVKAGQTVAILGATGSGKSTLFQLIPRLFEPTAGTIFIDGQDVRRIPAKTLRSIIGYVPQESFLFTGSVKENITWGKRNATMDEIEQAAKDAQIYDTILQFPQQFDTIIGQKGVNLSGGQKQRLAIARALVRKPKILLFDDSTSALDLNTERNLIGAIKKYDCTILMITQKISTAKQADQILLLDDGTIAAKGSHDQLLKESELYIKIVESQNQKELQDVYETK